MGYAKSKIIKSTTTSKNENIQKNFFVTFGYTTFKNKIKAQSIKNLIN